MSDSSKSYDFTVIGGGSAGYAAARTAAEAGLKTVVIEGGERVGGLCILRGCMPSKSLIESANRFRSILRASEFGLRASNPRVIPSEIIDRKNRYIGDFADYRRDQLNAGKFEFLRGHARFLDASTLELRSLGGSISTIKSKHVLIATGSNIQVPPIPGLKESGFITSDEALDLREFPESMIILGAGPVAMEMAHYFGTLGVDVTVIQRSDQILRGVDPEIAEVVFEAMQDHGISIFTDTQIQGIERSTEGISVTFAHKNSHHTITAAVLLNALGRTPNTRHLGLDAAGVECNSNQIKISKTMQTSNPRHFAAGDCSGPFEVVHTAITQGEIAARNAAALIAGADAESLESIDYRLKLFAVFTDPEVGCVGLTEAEADHAGLPAIAASYPFSDHGKSMVMGETHGMVKLVAHAESGEILGGAVVGPHASELIHEVVVAMNFNSTVAEFASIPHYHPTLSEIWTYPAEELAEQIPS